jgi:hypothetical protein
MIRSFCVLVAVVWGAAAVAARAESPLAIPVDSGPFRAELAGVDAQWQITFTAAGKQSSVPAGDLVQWGVFGEPANRTPILLLADGGLLVAEVLAADKENLTADSELFGTLKLPLEALAGLVFHPPATRQQRDALLERIAHATTDADRVLLENGDEVTGLLETIEKDAVKFRAEVGEVKIEIARIVAMIFNPTLLQKPKLGSFSSWTGLTDGTRLIATQLLLSKAMLTMTTATGQTWKAAPKDLVALQPLGGRVTYLSDLKAESYRHTPYLDLSWPYRTDRNVTGGLLRCGGRLYLKGIGTHSAARLTYALEGPYRRFEAELGIDDSTVGGGSVLFRVFVDGREKFTSHIVRGHARPLPVSVDLSGAKRLEIVVDYADRGDVLDHADWLGARLVK